MKKKKTSHVHEERTKGETPWSGDAVADAPPGEAEAAADRAAGRAPLPPERRATGPEESDESPPARPKLSAAEEREIAEQKRRAAMELHAADRAAGTGTAPKRL